MAMQSDEFYMRKALDLARSGVGLVSPNPAVGAIVVGASGRELGSGSHRYDEKLHAEVIALAAAGDRARGATLYINLEPCSHQGRTGPCADAVIAAEVRRVVCAMQDPNPAVGGAGFAKLRAAGIAVEIGLFEAEARKLNESFTKFIRTGKPFVTLKSAMSLDGKIAAATKTPAFSTSTSSLSQSEESIETPNGRNSGRRSASNPVWITSEASRTHVQQLRHQSDAILIGVGTVLADDPLLTDRTNLPRRRKLLRIILDSSLRIPMESRIIKSAANDVVVFSSAPDPKTKTALLSRGIRVCEIASDSKGRPDFSAMTHALGQMKITSVLVEGGSTVNRAALNSGEVDKLFLYYAPAILGPDAIPFIASGRDRDNDASIRRLKETALHRFAEDFSIEGYLRDPYAADL